MPRVWLLRPHWLQNAWLIFQRYLAAKQEVTGLTGRGTAKGGVASGCIHDHLFEVATI